MFTVQPHPEFRKEFMQGLIKYRGPGLVPDAILAEATDKIDTPLDSPKMADRIADFFKAHQKTKTENTTGAEKLRA
jgi:GMP synthase (glutamine-hydrolysing)